MRLEHPTGEGGLVLRPLLVLTSFPLFKRMDGELIVYRKRAVTDFVEIDELDAFMKEVKEAMKQRDMLLVTKCVQRLNELGYSYKGINDSPAPLQKT